MDFLLDRAYPDDAWDLLSPRFSEARRARMQQVAAGRTRRIRLVVQDVHQPHNISASLRSADAFGVQLVDVVTESRKYRPSTASRGVPKWLTLRPHATIDACATTLREAGYAIAAGYPDPAAVLVDALPLDRPLAVVFGNEHEGVSDGWARHLDYQFTIPMVGMVESLNISVSCAITLYTLRQRISRGGGDPELSEFEQHTLLNAWAYKGVSRPEAELRALRARR